MADGDYINLNQCRSGNIVLTNSLSVLSSFTGSEVYISNKTGQSVEIYDNNYSAASNAFLLDDNDTITIRGITNTNQVSAKTTAGTGTLYFRSQYYSFNPSR